MNTRIVYGSTAAKGLLALAVFACHGLSTAQVGTDGDTTQQEDTTSYLWPQVNHIELMDALYRQFPAPEEVAAGKLGREDDGAAVPVMMAGDCTKTTCQ